MNLSLERGGQGMLHGFDQSKGLGQHIEVFMLSRKDLKSNILRFLESTIIQYLM